MVSYSCACCRAVCDFGAPTILGATADARSNSTALQSFTSSYPSFDVVDSRAESVWKGPIFQPVEGTIDGYLLDTWHDGKAVYDGLFVNGWSNSSKVTPSLLTGLIPAFTVTFELLLPGILLQKHHCKRHTGSISLLELASGCLPIKSTSQASDQY